jgi:predicted house-cleaning noncanonical NTP pyrophosphatase (MazG superfamily)
MKRVLEKLVRDEIPARLEAAGVAYEARTASPDELGALLFAKLQEEVNELLGATSAADALDEVADILEVLAALASRYGADEEDLRLAQRRKRDTRGGFDRGVVLCWTETPGEPGA